MISAIQRNRISFRRRMAQHKAKAYWWIRLFNNNGT
nr:MAG TPA: hypothetical protein [Caudoviricetes sp.]